MCPIPRASIRPRLVQNHRSRATNPTSVGLPVGDCLIHRGLQESDRHRWVTRRTSAGRRQLSGLQRFRNSRGSPPRIPSHQLAVATFNGPFLRLVTEVGRDRTIGHYGRCVEGVGVHERCSGWWVIIRGQGGVWGRESVATQDVFEWCEFENLDSNSRQA